MGLDHEKMGEAAAQGHEPQKPTVAAPSPSPQVLPSTVTLRPATKRDYGPIVALSESSRVFSKAELLALTADLPACDPENGDRLIVYTDETRGVLGFIQYSPADITDATWFIYWIAVKKNTQGQGIGGALLDYAEADMRAAGCRLLVLETSSTGPYDGTRRFYLGRGYRLAGQISHYYAHGDDKCIFTKALQG